jgi:hypothetical protein
VDFRLNVFTSGIPDRLSKLACLRRVFYGKSDLYHDISLEIRRSGYKYIRMSMDMDSDISGMELQNYRGYCDETNNDTVLVL